MSSSLARKITPIENENKQTEPAWNRRILIVDDEPEIRSVYMDLLKMKDPKVVIQSSRSTSNIIPFVEPKNKFTFDVYEASNAEEALKIVSDMKLRGEKFAMGFFDVRLGAGIDGVELVHQIQKMDPEIYAVFVTAYNDRTIDSIASTLGTDTADRWDYMMKPFSSSEIIQKARNFVSLWNLNKESESHASQMSEINQRIQESERVTSVAAVARGVAHEFGNLLMQIMGKAEVSRNKSPEEMQKALDRIVDASQRAHEILDRFNHLSDTKSHTSLKAVENLATVINEAVDLLSHQFKKNNIIIKKQLKENITAKVHSTSLLQVLVNLFINSMHAMDGRGEISISLEMKDAEQAQIQIHDSGTGVPNELLEKVLEPFFTTKGDKGTGLGLAISREIIEIDHGGLFKLQNDPAGGLRVIIDLPLKGPI
jgi:signal transduction histidine kinase